MPQLPRPPDSRARAAERSGPQVVDPIDAHVHHRPRGVEIISSALGPRPLYPAPPQNRSETNLRRGFILLLRRSRDSSDGTNLLPDVQFRSQRQSLVAGRFAAFRGTAAGPMRDDGRHPTRYVAMPIRRLLVASGDLRLSRRSAARSGGRAAGSDDGAAGVLSAPERSWRIRWRA